MLKALRRILLIAVLSVGAAFLLYQGFLFWRALDKLPPSTVVAGVPVGGLTPDAAATRSRGDRSAPGPSRALPRCGGHPAPGRARCGADDAER